MHLVLQVHTEDALRAETDSDMSRLLHQAEESKLTGLQGHRLTDTSFDVTGLGPDTRDSLATLAEKYLANWSSQAQEGRMVFTMKPDNACEGGHAERYFSARVARGSPVSHPDQ